jgi:hypothetical protein
MTLRKRLVGTALAVCALVCVLPVRALASPALESELIDDKQLIYSSPQHTARVLGQLS